MPAKADVVLRIEKRIEAAEAQIPDLEKRIESCERSIKNCEIEGDKHRSALAVLLVRREGILSGIASDRELLSGSAPKQVRRKKPVREPTLGDELDSTKTGA